MAGEVGIDAADSDRTRLILRRTGGLEQGDANARPDESEVLPVQVKGTVWFAVPWLGWVNQFMGGARGWLVPVIAAALFSYAVWMIFAGLLGSRRRRSSPPDGEGETEPAHPSGARAGAAPGWP